MSYAIRIEGLGKRYDINRGGKIGGSIRDGITDYFRDLTGRSTNAAQRRQYASPTTGAQKALAREFWALRDVTLDIDEGERIGIIGANGAGKSTLLKILSRVTAPTEGNVEIRGKVASLLEVGTGFHPELSGRENIFLNGAILGMSRDEIRRKFDQIVDFSGVGNFLDTPVKHYSSGMYVRLAFSVSAWLDPDILIVDEVLAVGDQAFQRKCTERMKELTREGRTVLFVSHSMATINQMCQKALYLENGRLMAYGPVQDTTIEYHRNVVEQIETEQFAKYAREHPHSPPDELLRASGGCKARAPWRWHRGGFTLPDPSIQVLSEHAGEVDCLGGHITSGSGEVTDHPHIDQPIHVSVRYRVRRDLERDLVPSFNFHDETGALLFVALPETKMPRRMGCYTATYVLPPFLLNVGRFTVNLNLSDFLAQETTYFAVVTALRFEVIEPTSDPRRHGFAYPLPGYLRPRLRMEAASDS